MPETTRFARPAAVYADGRWAIYNDYPVEKIRYFVARVGAISINPGDGSVVALSESDSGIPYLLMELTIGTYPKKQPLYGFAIFALLEKLADAK